MLSLAVGSEVFAFIGPAKGNRLLTLEVIAHEDGKPAECMVIACNKRRDDKRIGDRHLVRASDIYTSQNGKPFVMFAG